MKPIKKNRLLITIRASASRLFDFLLDPNNTPKWIDGIVHEEVSALPVQEGTIYRNLNSQGAWNEYIVTSLEKNKSFIMKMSDGNYHVRYTLVPVSETETELEYFEWVIRDALVMPFTMEMLIQLKNRIETG